MASLVGIFVSIVLLAFLADYIIGIIAAKRCREAKEQRENESLRKEAEELEKGFK